MLATLAIRLLIGDLLAADTTTLAPATGNKIALINDDFVLDENLTYADLSKADFDGSTPIVLGSGAQPVGIDPVTGEQIITMLEPVGGLRWETTGVTNLPQTIYGYAVFKNGSPNNLYGIAKLPTPITLTAAGQEINLDKATFRIVVNPLN